VKLPKSEVEVEALAVETVVAKEEQNHDLATDGKEAVEEAELELDSGMDLLFLAPATVEEAVGELAPCWNKMDSFDPQREQPQKRSQFRAPDDQLNRSTGLAVEQIVA